MEFRNKAILLISPESWDHIFVSKHHYAIHLAKKGNRVFFLNPPGKVESISKTDFSNVFAVNYFQFPRGLRFFPSIARRILIKRKFNQLQMLCDTEFDVIWSFDNSVFFDFSSIPKNVLKISHIVDLSQNFQTAMAARTADYCFCNTELIKARLLKSNPHVFKINHGFNLQISDKPIMLPGKSKIKAVYAGNLAIPYLDWPILLQCVTSNPGVDFIFIGPGKDHETIKEFTRQLSRKDNCYFIGEVKANELSIYYKAAHVLLVCYQEKFQKSQVTNTHKMMEYLGSGKMIVATYVEEYAALEAKGLFLMSDNNQGFISSFKKALDELEFWNSEEKQLARKAFALDNTYEKQIGRIEKLITS